MMMIDEIFVWWKVASNWDFYANGVGAGRIDLLGVFSPSFAIICSVLGDFVGVKNNFFWVSGGSRVVGKKCSQTFIPN